MSKNWCLDDFDYVVPDALIAQHPLPQRSASRLMYVHPDQQEIQHHHFTMLPNWLKAHDLIIFNDTKVIPARLRGYKSSGGRVECLVERLLDKDRMLAHMRASKAPKPGQLISIDDAFTLTVLARKGELFELQSNAATPLLSLLQRFGEVPLPPYILRRPERRDEEDYQTIFARHPGAVAAPTAALHFDTHMLSLLQKKNIAMAQLTLHIGAGTFQPVREHNISQHTMHSEYVEVGSDLCEAIARCRGQGGRVIAVGTTVVRALETAGRSGNLSPFSGETQLFIYPGFRFQCIDALITNFHRPKSSLLMLVCAFAGYDNIMRAYQTAIQEHYRFFSYGDAMFIQQPFS